MKPKCIPMLKGKKVNTEIVTVPCLDDNYAYLIHDKIEEKTCLVDAPESKPIISVLNKKGWGLDKIFLTHHHSDHVAGLEEIIENFPAKICGAAADMERLPALDERLKQKDKFHLGKHEFAIMEVYGHTIGHIALYSQEMSAIFSGDSLMTLGCGRLFEGNPQMLWETIQKFCQLPPETKVYSGHEYGEKNAQFAISVDPYNKKLQDRLLSIIKLRAKNLPTVPSTIESELETNPFMRVNCPEFRNFLKMEHDEPHVILGRLRKTRDSF